MTETTQYFLKHQCDDESLQPLVRLPMLIQLFVGLYKERWNERNSLFDTATEDDISRWIDKVGVSVLRRLRLGLAPMS